MLAVSAVNKVLGLTKGTVSAWKAAVYGQRDRMPTLDKMEEMLTRYGARVVREKVWKVPKDV